MNKLSYVKTDCFHFLGEKPCKPHKDEGVKCCSCPYYKPIRFKILIIKLGAQGDVLRTTSILPLLAKKYKDPYITWVTEGISVDLLKNNPYIHSILEYGIQAFVHLQVEKFHLAINLDVTKEASALCTIVKAEEKLGYGLSPEGYICPLNPEAQKWLEMGLWDDVKRANTQSYQELMCEIIGIKNSKLKTQNLKLKLEPILQLTEDEIEFGRKFARKNGIKEGIPLIGVNTGGSSRWPLKRWTLEGFLGLIDLISHEMEAPVILLGGPKEAKINSKLKTLYDGGCKNSLREFASLINLCDLIVTGDSLALHMAVALKKKVVALFGPTSSTEIDLFGRGRKIVPNMDCVGCYRSDCRKRPNCMESIAPIEVFGAIKELL